ncbi:hypothetical protein HZH66_013395 [Vespula vulgaris]|uniref:Uncharacterized protein n=1 Tax=Vespula vulgaris TaxID=7454 RepID=A0A834J6U1_VESVU|nr:hypothetical protein HZH66_013395 [Vespula vulgaris]
MCEGKPYLEHNHHRWFEYGIENSSYVDEGRMNRAMKKYAENKSAESDDRGKAPNPRKLSEDTIVYIKHL